MIEDGVAFLQIGDNDNTRYAIPESSVLKPKSSDQVKLESVGFSYNLDPFSISFKLPESEKAYLTTENQSMVFMDKYIQMDFQLPSQRLFGFGERIREFMLEEGTWTMWAIGLDSPYDDGTGRKGVYGVHPFVMVQTEKKGDFIGIFFRNSNA
jgi:alpha-glucosidase (family GH31 glycosyl hydrolase)